MAKCPNTECGADYTPGESICMSCGCDLSPVSIPTNGGSASQAGIVYYCDPSQEVDGFPGCGNESEFEGGHTCPACGAYWATPVRKGAAAPPTASSGAVQHQAPPPATAPTSPGTPPPRAASVPAASPAAAVVPPPSSPPAPAVAPKQEASAHMVIEGGQTVFWDGRHAGKIPLNTDEISIGCRDIAEGHYPDVDLMRYRRNDPYLSRRHARLIRESGRHFLEVLSGAESTTLNGVDDIIQQGHENRHELQPGDRIFFSDSIVMRFEA